MQQAHSIHHSQVRRDNTVRHPAMVSREAILIRELIRRQREYFAGGETRDVKARIGRLRALKNAVAKHEQTVLDALNADLHKHPFEAYLTEIAVVRQEIDHALRNVKKWTRTRRVRTPLPLMPASSMIVPEPRGTVLIIAPWNYPFQLALAPLVGAVAAGNTAVIKPSEYAPRTAAALQAVIADAFPREHVAVVRGHGDVGALLLEERFDYLFFTGGTEVGRKVIEAAAKHITPFTLELGGKSPVIVEPDASIDAAARKIAWGKFLNAGQTCLAPDYLLVHRDVRDKLLERIRHYIVEFYGKNPAESPHFGRIISRDHFHRVSRLLRSGRKVVGGQTDEASLYIAPTVLDDMTFHHPAMKEEIFGPILPVIAYDKIDDAIAAVNAREKPLALYVFTNDRKTANRVLRETSSGGAVVNDVMLHVGNHHLPFGGIGRSGTGAYHGRFGFETFSHLKSVMKRSRLFDAPLRYAPYTGGIGILKRLIG